MPTEGLNSSSTSGMTWPALSALTPLVSEAAGGAEDHTEKNEVVFEYTLIPPSRIREKMV